MNVGHDFPKLADHVLHEKYGGNGWLGNRVETAETDKDRTKAVAAAIGTISGM